jgi:aminopeptidase-like protein
VTVPDEVLGTELQTLVEELYPICRSITGDGVRQTLRIVGRHVPVDVHEVASGTPVLDWTVPLEWNVRDAYVADSAGHRVIDFRANNLHLVSYSVPIVARMPLEELLPHLHTIPEQPDLIPYRTSYYHADWGFCLAHRQLESLAPGEYQVVIDSELAPGSLTYGEIVVPGQRSEEVLVSAHICHPSLADDNLSGIAVSTMLAQRMLTGPTPRHTFRFVLAPGTIGAITWLARNRELVSRIRHGLTLTCLGDDHPLTYKRTVDGRQLIDRAAAHALASAGVEHDVIDFFPYGYDERQYNSPGFRLPVGSLMRGRHGQFPQYHTSADDPSFVHGDRMVEALLMLEAIFGIVDAERRMRNVEPFGEPQLGRRGLYQALGGAELPDLQFALLWVLNLSDGGHGLLDIAERSQLGFRSIVAAAELLEVHGLLEELDGSP